MRGGASVEATSSSSSDSDLDTEDGDRTVTEVSTGDEMPLNPTTASTTSSTTSSTSSTSTNHNENDKLYYIQQQLLLQSRSLQIRQALIQRGLHTLAHTTSTSNTGTTVAADGTKQKGNTMMKQQQVVDWECALSTEEYPKSCLYSLDAEYGQKVIAPMLPSEEEDEDEEDDNDKKNNIDTTKSKHNKKKKKHEWITISSLNRLYRTDPNKVEPLWYDQYAILSTWFSRSSSSSPHPYSLYTHFSHNIYATLITTALNVQPAWLLSVVFVVTTLTVFGLLFLPVIETGVTMLTTSSFLWNQWPTWSRFTTHAALPVQLLMVQMIFGFIQQGIHSLTNQLRTILIDEECRLLQNCIPLTILEGRQPNNMEPDDITTNTNCDADDDKEDHDGEHEEEEEEDALEENIDDDEDDE